MRASKKWIAQVDAWRRKQSDLPSRGEAIRRLVEISLTVHPGRKPKRGDTAARAAGHTDAERAAHDYIDNALKHHPEHVRTARKKQLTTMPAGAKQR